MSQTANNFLNTAAARGNDTPVELPTAPAFTHAAGGVRIGRFATGFLIVGGLIAIAVFTGNQIGFEKFVPGLKPDPTFAEPSAEYLQAVAAGIMVDGHASAETISSAEASAE